MAGTTRCDIESLTRFGSQTSVWKSRPSGKLSFRSQSSALRFGLTPRAHAATSARGKTIWRIFANLHVQSRSHSIPVTSHRIEVART